MSQLTPGTWSFAPAPAIAFPQALPAYEAPQPRRRFGLRMIAGWAGCAIAMFIVGQIVFTPGYNARPHLADTQTFVPEIVAPSGPSINPNIQPQQLGELPLIVLPGALERPVPQQP